MGSVPSRLVHTIISPSQGLVAAARDQLASLLHVGQCRIIATTVSVHVLISATRAARKLFTSRRS
jgi:hypothetical protein